MKVITNTKIINRNKKIGQVTSVVSLLILGAGLYLSMAKTDLLLYSFIALMIGFLLSQVGIYYGSRWGKSPRPDEMITASLKGLEDKYQLYHYSLVVPHLLIGPAGIWLIAPYSQGGQISYDEKKGRWKQKGGNAYMKIFGQESLGRPDLDVQAYQQDIQKFFNKDLNLSDTPDINTVLVFTNEKVQIDANNAPVPTIPLSKLKDLIRKKAKEKPQEYEEILEIQKLLPEE